jgi:hypothetical protein
MVARRPVPLASRKIVLRLSTDEHTLERLAALLLFSTVAPHTIEEVDWTPDVETIQDVAPTESEDVRAQVRELLHAYADKHGMALAKALLAESGATGVSTANAPQLAHLRHHLDKWRAIGETA